ncbi:MAG: hypothetical protein VX484_03055, partial [Chloroflexota bacterium]|nr:hypothetical protein [Chloroflexota bacterium]
LRQEYTAIQERFADLERASGNLADGDKLKVSAEHLARQIEEGVEEILDQGSSFETCPAAWWISHHTGTVERYICAGSAAKSESTTGMKPTEGFPTGSPCKVDASSNLRLAKSRLSPI